MIGLGIAVRTLHLGASLALAGLFTFLLLVARPAFQVGKRDLRSAPEHFDAGLLRLAGWSLVVLFLTALLGFWVQLATATGRPLLQALAPDTTWSLLTTTQYGRVWMIRMALMAGLGGILWLRGREQDGRDWWALRLEVVGLAVSILVAHAWTGHSATGEGWTLAYRVTADALHLAASGVWLGSLPALFFLLTRAQRSDDPQAALPQKSKMSSKLTVLDVKKVNKAHAKPTFAAKPPPGEGGMRTRERHGRRWRARRAGFCGLH